MGRIRVQIGNGLRRARRGRDLTLRDVSRLSGGRYKPTSVAGYERGERAISLERFCDLCQIYGIPAHTLLAEILESVEPTTEPHIDVAILESLESVEAALVSGFVREIQALRHGAPSERIVLRAGDVQILATAAGKTPEELLDILGPRGGPKTGLHDAPTPSET